LIVNVFFTTYGITTISPKDLFAAKILKH